MSQIPYQEVSEIAKLFGARHVTRKAKRPDLSIEIKKATSAQDVANSIQSAWVTYGASDVMPQEDGSYTFTISGQKFETFDGAMQYLWFKPSKSDKSLYKMSDLKGYEVIAVDQDGKIEVTVRDAGSK